MDATLKVKVDGSQGAAGAKDVEANIRSMNEEGKRSSAIFDTITSSLQKFGTSAGSIANVNSALQVMAQLASVASATVTAALAQITNQANAAARAIGGAPGGGGGGGGGGGIAAALSGLGGAASGLSGIFTAVFSVDLILQFAKTIYDVSNRLQGFVSTMSVVTGSVSAAKDELNYIFGVANKWGANVDSITQSYAKLAAAAKGTALEGSGVRKVFEAITQAGVGMHLSAQDMTLVFFALQQMVSKGKVSMEELRKQLAERFPGAIQLAADALNTTVDGMEKMIRKGEVLSEDFLPKFAEKIQEAFGGAAKLASGSLLAEMNRLGNAWEFFLMKLAQSGVIEAASVVVAKLTSRLTENTDMADAVGKVISELINKFSEMIDRLTPESISEFFRVFIAFMELTVKVLGILMRVTVEFADKLGLLLSGLETTGGAMKRFGEIIEENIPILYKFLLYTGTAPGGLYKIQEAMQGVGASAAAAAPKVKSLEDQLNDLDHETMALQKTQARNLSAAQSALVDSERSLAIKTKEITAEQRLAEMMSRKIQLQKDSENIGLSDSARIQAYNALVTLNKELGAVQNEVNKNAARMSKEAQRDLNAQWKATETLTKKLEDEGYALTHTRREEELRAAAIAVSTIKSKADREAMFDRLVVIIDTNDAIRRAQLEEKELYKAHQESVKALEHKITTVEKELEKEKELAETYGKTKAQIEELKAARLDADIAAAESLLISKSLENACTEEGEKIKVLIEDLKALKAQREKNAGIINNVDTNNAIDKSNKKMADDFQKTADSISQSLTDALMRGFEDGKSFAQNFKDTVKNLFKTLILKPIIEPIVAQGVGSFASLLGLSPNSSGPGFSAGSGGGFGSIFNLLSGGGGGGNGSFSWASLFNSNMGNGLGAGSGTIIDTWFSKLFGGNSGEGPGDAVGQLTGLGTKIADGFSKAISGATIGYAIGSAAASMFGNQRNQQGMQIGGTVGGIAGSFIGGPLGAVIGSMIGSAIGSLLKSGGGPKSGGFYASGATPGISGTDGSGRWFTPTDQDMAVKRIVDATAKSYSELLRTLGGKGSASFALGFSTDPKGTAGNNVHSGVFMNGQQIYNNAQGDLGRDPEVLKAALETESKRALLAALQASDLPAYMAKIFKSVDVMTADSSTIDDLMNLAQGLKQVVDVMPAMADVFNSMDPDQIQGFVDAMGGLESMGEKMKFISDNFVSSAQRQTDAQNQLNDTFGSLGIEVPKTHQAFLDLLSGIDLTTTEGQTLYATIANMAPAFVTLNGSADDAAQAVERQAEANRKLQEAAQDFFDKNFLSDSEKAARAVKADWNAIFDTWNEVGVQLMALGYKAIPTTNEGFKKLVLGIDRSTDAGEALYQRLLLVAPAILDLNSALADTNKQLDDAINYFNQNFTPPEVQIQQFWDKVHEAWTQYGSQIVGLTGMSSIPTTTTGFYNFMTALKDLGPAGEALYNALLPLAPTIHDLNGAIDSLGNGAVDAIDKISQALERSQGMASAFATEFDKVMGAINDIVNQSGGSFGDKLALKISLIPEQIKQIQAKIDREMASGGMYSPYMVELQKALQGLQLLNATATKQLARFTILTAQYGEAKAEELVNLEDWYAQTKDALAGNADALAALQVIFDKRWKDIIDGVAGGVDGTASELERLQKSIQDFIKGLLIGDLSPLTPQQKLAEAKAQYEKDLALAQGGDLEAMGRLTQDAQAYLDLARQFYASSPMYTEIFNSIVDQLKAISKYAEPQVTQDATNAALVATLPSGSTIASEANIESLKAAVTTTLAGTMADVVSANDEASSEVVTVIKQKFDELITAINMQPK